MFALSLLFKMKKIGMPEIFQDDRFSTGHFLQFSANKTKKYLKVDCKSIISNPKHLI